MAKVKVNADGVGWEIPNPTPNQPPLALAAYRGAVVEMPDSEADRLRRVRVRVYYTDPITGVPAGAYREEPAVLNANEAEAADAEAAEAARTKVRELEDALAQARADLPLSATGSGPAPSTVVPTLLPSQGAPRLLDDAKPAEEPPGPALPTLSADESPAASSAAASPTATASAPPAPAKKTARSGQ